MKNNRVIYIYIVSFLFAFFITFGTSFLIKGNLSLLFNNILNIVLSVMTLAGLFLFFSLIITKLFNKLDKGVVFKDNSKVGKFYKYFDEHPFYFSLFFIIICWLPYIISFYPAILSPDPSFQIKQFFGIPNKYSDYAILLDENVIITNHHPVLHTLLLGGCLKFGNIVGSDNLGLFLYSFIQIIVLSCTLAYTVFYMKKIGTSLKFRKIVLFLYAFVPMFPFYAMSAVKDVIFGALIIIYISYLYDFIKSNSFSKKKIVSSIIVMLLLCLFRNNGIYVILMSFPWLFIKRKKNVFKLLFIFVFVVGSYFVYDNVVLPYYKITPGSIREMLSIPFQQTARYVTYHNDELSASDIKIIDNILGYKTLEERYNPDLADPVKNEFNKYASNDDLKKYFSVWADGLFRHPITYIEATMNNTYGYFYPFKTNWYIYYKYDKRIVEDGFNYHYISFLKPLRTGLSALGMAFPYIILIGLISNIGFNTWVIILMISYLLYRKKFKYLIFLLPSAILILVCIASPANAYFRYALPYIFAMPLSLAIFNDAIK